MKRPCINQRVVVSLKGMYKEDLLWEDPVKRESIPHISVVSAQQRPVEEKKALLSTHANALPQHPGPKLSKDSVLALASLLQAVSPMVCGRLYLPVISETNRWKVSDEGHTTTIRRKRGEANKPPGTCFHAEEVTSFLDKHTLPQWCLPEPYLLSPHTQENQSTCMFKTHI